MSLGLYLHIPYCFSKCRYCDFYSAPGQRGVPRAYVDAHAAERPSCLCFTGEAEKLGVPCVEYGREGDGADQARHIFRSLRALDEQGDAVVYARCPQKDGLSMAVYNRLIRAAAFRVIEL